MDVEFVIILGSFAVLLTSLAFFVRYDQRRNEEAYERAFEDKLHDEISFYRKEEDPSTYVSFNNDLDIISKGAAQPIITSLSEDPWPFPTGERPVEKKSTKSKTTKKVVKKTNRKTK